MFNLNLEELLNLPWNQFVSDEELLIYDYIAGQIKHSKRPYHSYDLNPDIIMKIKLPEERYVSLKNQPDLSQLITFEAKQLSRVYSRAEKVIASDMDRQNKSHEYIRMFTSIQQTVPSIIQSQVAQQQKNAYKQQKIEIKCEHVKNQQIDLFTIRINTIIYVLQKYCGFRVRSFFLKEQKTKTQALFMFLSLSEENLLKSAQNYRIKKEIYPSSVDFYINDPSNSDGRPLKFDSSFQQQRNQIKYNKVISRFFKEHDSLSNNSFIIQEKVASHSMLSNFVAYNESAFELLLDIRQSKFCKRLLSHQKMLIYNYTKKKNMKACLSVFTHHKKRQYYHHLLTQLNYYHGFKVYQSIRTFKEFFLPNKESKGASFKGKIQALVMFVPQITNIQGQLDFFSRMQRTKMCYLRLKNAFKLDFLNKLHYQLFTLCSDYQKFGVAPRQNIYQFANVVNSWPFHSFLTDIYPIRNYFGNNVGFQIFTVVSIVQYLASVSIIYLFIFLVQQFNDSIMIVTRYINSVLFVTGVQVFSSFWKQQQSEFINRYSDQKDSHIFLGEYKGPYVRNPLNDQLNQFNNTDHQTNFLGNFICTATISGLLVAIGGYFIVIRQLLLHLSGTLGQHYLSIFSLEHFLAYFLYFTVLMIFQQSFAKKIAYVLIKFLNPSTQYHSRKLEKNITFNFLLGIQFIGPLFFLVIEPLNMTSCFADSCRTELQYYVSSRYIFITAFNLFQLAYLALFDRIKQKQSEEIAPSFQSRLTSMLQRASIEASKKEFEFDHAQIIVYMITFAMYCTLVTNSCLYSFLGMFVIHFKMRMKLLYQNRRPIDKSQEILPFSPELNTMYYFGVIFNSWIVIFGYEFVQNYCQHWLEMLAIDDRSSLFMTKLIVTALYSIGLLIFGEFLKQRKLLNKYLQMYQERRNKKLEQYDSRKTEMKAHYNKIENAIPLRTIFRTFNDGSVAKRLILQYLLGKKMDNDQLLTQTNLIKLDI